MLCGAPSLFTNFKEVSEWNGRYIPLQHNDHLTILLVKIPTLNWGVPVALIILLTQDETPKKNVKYL